MAPRHHYKYDYKYDYDYHYHYDYDHHYEWQDTCTGRKNLVGANEWDGETGFVCIPTGTLPAGHAIVKVSEGEKERKRTMEQWRGDASNCSGIHPP